MKILTVVGARPQFIKAAAVSRTLRGWHREVLLHTGQHYDDGMSSVFFRDLDLPRPDHELGVGSGTHAEQTARMLVGIESVVLRERPDLLLVYGDTNSTLAGALAAAKAGVPVAHVEAGCRSFDLSMPEEINRVTTDRVSRLLFCPTRRSVDNLAREGMTAGVHQVGDVMWDLLLAALPKLDEGGARLPQFDVSPRRFVVATIHRAANTDRPGRLAAILEALGALDEPVVFPVHPRTRKAIDADALVVASNVKLIDPVGYAEMLALVRNARVAVTDSGGVQKEAFFLGTPCVTVRETTEWPETIDAGWNRLVAADVAAIVEAVRRAGPGPSPVNGLFGDGRAADRIVDVLGQWTGDRA